MTRRRLLVTSVLLAFLLALAAAALLAQRAWQGFLQDQGLEELDWQGLSLSREGLKVEHFSLTRVQAGHRLEAQALAWTGTGRAGGHNPFA